MKLISEALTEFIQLLKSGSPEHGIAPHNDPALLDRWAINMETQINVSAAGGVPVEGVRGTYCDPKCPDHRWWNIRIPHGAMTDMPTFEDKPLPWPPILHVNGLGCTGWDYADKVSRWAGYDFDSITGHAAGVGISDAELDRVRERALLIPWVEVRRSSGGGGYHLYVRMLIENIRNHTEHMALARAILGMMSDETGFDFASQIDACGGNMWIWHRKMTTENGGFKLIKPATATLTAADLPANWRDHVEVVTRKRSRVAVRGVEDHDAFDALSSSIEAVALDDQHRAIIEALRPYCEWVADHNCLRVHTCALAALMDSHRNELKLRGIFHTNSAGNNPHEPNAFMFPQADGGWAVYRFSPGITEAPTWRQDGEGWTTCSFNQKLDLETAARAYGGKEDAESNQFHFETADNAIAAANALGAKIGLPRADFNLRTAAVKSDRGNLIVHIERHKEDPSALDGPWINKAKHWSFSRRCDAKRENRQRRNYDDLCRLIITPDQHEAGWLMRGDNAKWDWLAKSNVQSGLLEHYSRPQAEQIIARCVNSRWTLVHLPFQPEYPGKRQLNLNAPQYRFAPAETDTPHHPHWDMVLRHCFAELDEALSRENMPWSDWTDRAGVKRGLDYGRFWIACLLREPFQPLPYLFLHSVMENTGKSILHEAIKLLITGGVADAKNALTNANGYNGELAGAILAYIDEFDLSAHSEMGRTAHQRIKAWVTAQLIPIRKMRTDTYTIPNTLHFIHTANSRDFCPIFSGDTRITCLEVAPLLADEIPKTVLLERLEAEAPHFMRTLMNVTLVAPDGRLRMPVVETRSKLDAAGTAKNDVESFIDAECVRHDGELLFTEVYDRFAVEHSGITKRRFTDALPAWIGRRESNSKTYLTGLTWRC